MKCSLQRAAGAIPGQLELLLYNIFICRLDDTSGPFRSSCEKSFQKQLQQRKMYAVGLTIPWCPHQTYLGGAGKLISISTYRFCSGLYPLKNSGQEPELWDKASTCGPASIVDTDPSCSTSRSSSLLLCPRKQCKMARGLGPMQLCGKRGGRPSPAPAVATIWGVSQEMEGLSVTLPFKVK